MLVASRIIKLSAQLANWKINRESCPPGGGVCQPNNVTLWKHFHLTDDASVLLLKCLSFETSTQLWEVLTRKNDLVWKSAGNDFFLVRNRFMPMFKDQLSFWAWGILWNSILELIRANPLDWVKVKVVVAVLVIIHKLRGYICRVITICNGLNCTLDWKGWD